MAKCFQVVGQGVPVRMSDADALQIVERDQDGQYCPKSVWKRERDGDYRTEQGDTCLYKLGANGRLVSVSTLQFNAQHKRRGRG